jgi:predicted metal-dependent phosphotriesterase family hydrolase
VLRVIALAAQHDLVLETGHSAPRESLQIIAEAKRHNVRHVVVTHAMTSPGGAMTLAEMQEAATLGALLELVYSPLTDEQLRKEADAIRAIGASSFILSSDLGQPQNPLHTDGLLAMYRGLMAHGISAADIDTMARKNPARLLGLP